jgi:hypothetical protein
MMLDKKIVTALIVLGILLTAAYRLPITGKIEAISELEKASLSGEILSVEHTPDKPKILEPLTITIVVKNDGKEKNSYLLDIKITKNGQLKYGDEFIFSLLPDKTVSFSPTYNLDEVGEYDIALRLYDKNKANLYDEKILTFVAQSDVGPFDLEVDMPTHIIGLGDSLPATIKITNTGTYGTDIGLNLDLYCTSGKKISKSMYIFLNGSSAVKNQLFVRTCGDLGQHTLVASLILYGKELLSSKNQFYVNSILPEVYMSTQHWIKAKSGEKTSFGIELTNPNDFDLINIKPFVYGMPPEWLFIKPSSLNALKPNESVLFTATLDVPENAETKSYEITIGIGGDNVFSKKEAILSVTGVAAKPSIPTFSLYQLLSSYWVHIVLVLAAILLLYLFFRWKRKEQWGDRRAVLKKIRGAMH